MSTVTAFSSQYNKVVPPLHSGLQVRVHQKIKEGDKTRIQIFEGLIIKTNSGSHSDATFTVRKVVDGVGVEKIFPLHSSNIEKVVVKKAHRVRRAKLYYMRDRSGKSANLTESSADLGRYKIADTPEVAEMTENEETITEENMPEEQTVNEQVIETGEEKTEK